MALAAKRPAQRGRTDRTYLVGQIGTRPVLLGVFPIHRNKKREFMNQKRRRVEAIEKGFFPAFHADNRRLASLGI